MALTADPSTVAAKKLQDAIAAALGGYRTPGGLSTAAAPVSYAGAGTQTSGGGRTYLGAPGPGGGGGGGSGSGSNPYETDPGYLAALAAEQAGSQQADAALRAAQEAAIVGYGDPSLAAALGVNVDENTQAAARQNYLAGNSTLSRIDRSRDLANQSSINNLAAHGMVFSGETGYQQGQNEQARGRNIYDAQQAILSAMAQARAGNVASKQGLHQSVVDALMGAYDRYAANPSLYGGAGQAPGGPPGGGGTQRSLASQFSVTGPSAPAPLPIAKPAVRRSPFYRPTQIH